eukprot:1556320-Amphidinium_carterae.1
MSWRALDQLAEMPWSLSMGNIEENLDMLCLMSEPPQEAVASRLWHLHRCGMEKAKLLSVMAALQNTSFTSYFTERQHAFVSSLTKRHDYGKTTLQARALLATFRLG